MSNKTVWICNQCKYSDDRSTCHFEFAGVFDTEELAIANCNDESYGIGPATINEPLPSDSVVWPGYYYPKARETKGD